MADGLATGLRVIEIGASTSAAVAGMVMADYGADVTVIEPPGGGALRSEAAYPMWTRGKAIENLDLGGAAGAARLHELVAGADVALVALKPASADRLGVDGKSLCAANDRLVHCEITGFGRGHPLSDVAGYEAVVAARGGRAYEFSVLFEGARPAFPAVPVASHGAAMLTLQGVFAALHERDRTGRGQRVETSLLRSLGVYDLASWTPGNTRGLRTGDMPVTIYPVARTADGVWLQFSQNSPSLYRAFMCAIDLEWVYDDERFARLPAISDVADARELRGYILERVAARTWPEWRERFDLDPDVSAEPFLAPGEAFSHPQMIHNGDAEIVDDERWGASRQLGRIAAIEERGQVATPAVPDDDGERPLLDGVTVIELATWIATPLASALLADLGARVIKVEPLSGDPMRMHGDVGMKCVQGKESIALDLKSDEGREIVHGLVAGADVVMHNYRPGVPERLGIDDATLRAINPGLVYLYGASYGSTGPMSARPAFHVTAGAVTGGVVAQVGAGGLPGPDAELTGAELAAWSLRLGRSNESHPDFNAALAAAAAVTMGLYARAALGRGQSIETRMMTANAYTMSRWFIDHPERALPPIPDADLLGTGALHRLYPAATGWVLVAAGRDHEFAGLCELLGRSDLVDDPRFATSAEREANDGALASELATLLSDRDPDDLEADAGAAGVGVVRADQGPIWSYVADAPWAAGSRVVADSEPVGQGPYLRYDRPVTGESTLGPPGVAEPAGSSTRSLLAGLGYPGERIDALFAAGVVVEPPHRPEG